MEVYSQVSPLTLNGVADTLDRRDVERDECCRRVRDQDGAVLHIDVDLAWNDVLWEVLCGFVGTERVHALDLILGVAAPDLALVVADLQLFFFLLEKLMLMVLPSFHFVLLLLLINSLGPKPRGRKLRNTLLHYLLAALRP